MKRIIIVAIALLGVMGLRAQPDDYPARMNRNQFLFSPIYLFDATFFVSYEHLFRNNSALRISPSITISNSDNSIFQNNFRSREGFGVDAGYKIFLYEKPHRNANLYMGPYFMYKYMKIVHMGYPDDVADIYKIWGVGIDTGVKFTMGRFVMDITIGGGVRYPLLNDDPNVPLADDILDINYKGIAPRINFCLGVTL